jgi:hypothetical protein
MNACRALLVFVAFALSACGGADEPTCALLGEIPDQVGDATLEQVEGVARAAQESEVSELRTLGDRLTLNLARGPALRDWPPAHSSRSSRRACAELDGG